VEEWKRLFQKYVLRPACDGCRIGVGRDTCMYMGARGASD
jgi:hypothetical protein